MTDDLYHMARAVRENAHAPYSKFKVGAAIRSRNGIHVGCNVENAALPDGICAEGGAITSMVAAGDKEILEVLVYAESDSLVAPCGGCRQKLSEFAGPDVKVTMAGPDGITATMKMDELLPAAFLFKPA
ncbi:cytidine deaminase [Henriciella barbarensis]|uniref:cytidine deaminase n=1 Tax=Henriciella barbarensis TaxID=86342 RepID=UPI001F452A16|nr:cytidine deaminase [Henriciella barbarensis]